MRLGYFTMPLHPAHRAPSQTLEEDREAVILADKLGFYDAFVGEHLTEKSENVTNSFIFLATLVHATERIKLATGTSNLSHSHPALIASHAAMFDHLARGRFIFGVSPGALRSDAEAHRRDQPRRAVQALSAAAARDRRHGRRTRLQGGDRHGRARLPSAVGEFPALPVAAEPLAE